LECADSGGALDFQRGHNQSGVAQRLPPHSKTKSPNQPLLGDDGSGLVSL